MLGDISRANGDPSLARYGMDGWVSERQPAPESSSAPVTAGVHVHKSAPVGSQTATTHLKVTPNLHALADRFAISDNFFVDSDVSADGHRWVVGINPTPYLQHRVDFRIRRPSPQLTDRHTAGPSRTVRRGRCAHA